jgi:hypothetical protein
MLAICIILAGLLFATRCTKGPIWALGISWLVCILPIAISVIDYHYFSTWDVGFAVVLTTYLLCFVIGVVVHDRFMPLRPLRHTDIDDSYLKAKIWAQLAWMGAAVGTLCLIIDFLLYKAPGINNLASLREFVVEMESATWLARISSVLTWGGLYCFAFALFFREKLSRSQFILFFLPIGGYFLSALLSAGRQAALQIVIFTLLIQLLKKSRSSARHTKNKTSWALLLGVFLAMVVYMGYVAINRNDGLISHDKTEVLAHYFDYTISPWFDQMLGLFGNGARATFIEAMVYFSSPVPLFSKFLTLDFPQIYAGAMTFPFVMRQIESFTGVSIVGTMRVISQLMNEAGVIGVGWSTSISTYILDFGRIGAAIVLFMQGFYTAFAWRRAIRGNDFNEVLIALVLLTAVIYMPLIAASADTNLFLLWVFGVVALVFRKRGPFRARLQ